MNIKGIRLRKKNHADPSDQAAAEEKGGRKMTSVLALALVAVAAVAFLIFSLVQLIGVRSDNKALRRELNELHSSITVQEIKNEDMSKKNNMSDEERSDYIEQIARDELDYVREGERVFVNVAGD